MSERFVVGSSVCWRSQAGGRETVKVGTVRAVVAPKTNPAQAARLACGEVVPPNAKDASVRRLNAPSVFEVIERALGQNPEFGSIVEIAVRVKIVKKGKPSKKRCHNPWPAHVCRRSA